MATTLLSDSLPAVSDAPQLDVPDTITPTITTDAVDIGLRSQSADTAITHPLLSDIVRSDGHSYEDRVSATRRFEDDMATKITEAGVDSKHKDAAFRKLDTDVAIANSELFKDWHSSKVNETFPTIAERDAFGAAALKGGSNPDAYDDPKHKQFIADLNEASGNLFGGLNRSWTGEATTPGGYKVAGYTVKPMSNGEALVNLKMQGQEPSETLAVPAMSPVIVPHPEQDKGWDTFSKSIKITLPTQDDVTLELTKADQRLAELRSEIPAAKARIKTAMEGPTSDPNATAIAALAQALQAQQLEAESKQLQQRRDLLSKDGKRTLANERVADTIRTTPELVSQIRDRGVAERLSNATDSLIMSLNVVGEEIGLPWQQGARKGAAEAMQLQGQAGRGMDQAEFRGSLADKIGIATIENIPLLAMQAGSSGAGVLASLGPMAVSSYGQNLVAAEQQAQAAEDRGDHEGALKIRDSARSYASLMAIADVGTEMMWGPEGAPLSKAAQGMKLMERFGTAPIKEGVEEIAAGVIQSQFAPLIGNYEYPFSSDRLVEFGAGFLGSQFQQIPGALFNKAPTKQEQVSALQDAMKQLQADAGVNVHDSAPIDITARAVPVMDESGRQSSADNPFAMHQPEGSQNWTITDPALRQRAFESGVKTEFPTEQEASKFAQTMHQSIAEAELRNAAAQAGIPQEQTESSITLISSALKQAAIAEGQRTDNLWARYQFQFMPESNPSKGTEQPSPEATPAPETQPPPTNGKEEEKGQTLLAPQQEAPAPATADQTAASTEAVNASQESSPPAQEPSLPAAAPVGETSIPATTENATPAEAPVPSWIQAEGDRALASLNADQVETIKRMAANRSTAREIAKALGVEESDVIAARSKLGIPSWTTGTNLAGSAVQSPEFTAWRDSYLKEQKASAPPAQESKLQAGREAVNTIKGQIDTPLGPLHHALISLTTSSDVSTIMHEFIHGLALLETPIAEGKTRSLLQSVLGDKAKGFYAWASQGTESMSPDEAYVRMHERIAEGFEKWLTDGSLPEYKNQGMLRKAFESIRSAMRGIVRDMLGKGFNFQHIDPSKALPANVQAAYQQLFALLDRDSRMSEHVILTVLQQIGANNAQALDAIYPLTNNSKAIDPAYPFTRPIAGQRVAFTPAELEEISKETGDSVVELTKQAYASVAKANSATLFQSVGEGLPADKAKYLIDAGTAAMVNALAKNNAQIPTYEEWINDIKSTGNQAFAGLGEPAMQTIYYASTLNIPATQAASIKQQIESAVMAVGDSVTPESKAVFSDAISAVLPSMQPAMAKRLSVAAKAVAEADTAKKQSRAMNAAMKIVRADAKSKFAITSQRLYNLLKGYRIGTGNADQVRDIIDEVNKVIKPLLKSGEIGSSTKKLVEDTMKLMGYSARGDVDMQDVVALMQHNLGLVQNDLARSAEANFIRGAKAGGKHATAQFKARQEAIIGVILDNLKTVTGLSPTMTERAIKLIRVSSTEKQLNKATWKAMLLFQDQRVRDAYDHVNQLQTAIKENIKKGKFGDLSDWVGQLISFESHTIPQHMLAQYLAMAEPLASKAPVILLNGLKNQLESMNRQLDQWLEANPEEEQTRPQSLSNGFAEALERMSILDDLDAAKRTRQREKFVTEQQGFGKSKEMADEAARAIAQMRVFETFEEADEEELSSLTNRQLRGVANAFANYNAGIVTPFIVQKAQDIKAQKFQKLFLPQLTYGVRHFLRLSGDARLDAPDADLRANGIMGRILGWTAGYRTLTDKVQAKGVAAWVGGSIEGQFREAGLRNFDSVLNTAQWINENVSTPMERSQVTGLLERDRILTMKDEHGKSVKDYELDLDDPSHYNESLIRAMTPELSMGLFSNLTSRVPVLGEKVSNIKNARREMMSRIMGMAMHQRQREQNGMEGNYIDYMLAGAMKRKGTVFVDNEFKRQQAAARVIKKMLGTQKATAANISAFLPETAKRAMALTDRIFDRTGQWTYFLNMIENESLLPMPEAYFPIMSMEENTTIEQRVKNLTGIPLGSIGSIIPRTSPRAASRHARVNENLKMANADFFGVVSDAVHQAAADSAMTPFLKVMDRGFNGIQRLTTEQGTPMFGGAANNVVVELHKALIEHGARMSHVILADPGVATKISTFLASIFPKMVLDKVQRPLVEGVGNLTTIMGYGEVSLFASGLGSVWAPHGEGSKAWGELMLKLKAPTALRNGSESTTGQMQDLAAAITTAFEADPHAPTWIENLVAEVKNKRPQRQGFLQRSQSHVLARLTSSLRHLMVTAGEQMWMRPYWVGVFEDSMYTQTGNDFSMDAYKAGAYSEQQLSNAVSAAETEIARIMSPSARGANRLSSQVSLAADETSGLFKNMIYAMTNFIGSQSNTGKYAMKALIEGRAGNIDKRSTAAQMMAGLVVGNVVNNVASSFFVIAMRAFVDKLRLDDDEEKKSVALQQFNEWLSNANPLNVKSAGAFWGKVMLRSAFSLRFGGMNTLARFLVGTATETLWWGVGTAAGGFKSGYDPFKDNLTYESEPGITAALGYQLGISDDPQLMRAFQNTNVLTSTRLMGSVNALVQLGSTMANDVSGIKRMMSGEGDGVGAAMNLAVNAGLLLSSAPFYATMAESTGQLAKLESPWYKDYQNNALSRIAKRAGKEYAATGDVKYKNEYEAMPKEYQKLAQTEIIKAKFFERASTVPGNDAATKLVTESLNSIRHAPESERPAKMASQYRKMEEAGLKKEFLRGVRILRQPEAKYGDSFGSSGSSSDFANELKSFEKAHYGKPSSWIALYGQ